MIDITVCFYGCGKEHNGPDDLNYEDADDFVCKDCREIERLVKNMNVPEFRTHDFGWLRRNLSINNSQHPDFARAWELLGKQRRK